jgi:hypothetical protein
MGKKSSKKQLAVEAAANLDLGKARQEQVMAQEAAFGGITSAMGSMPIDGAGAPQIGGSAAVAGGGGAGAGFLTDERIGHTTLGGDPLISKRLGKRQVTSRGTAEDSLFRRRDVSEAAKLQAGKGKKAQARISAYGGGYELDPEQVAKRAIESKAGQMHNRLMVEADQFLKREGPLYDAAIRSFTGPIMEGAAEGLDDAMADLQLNMARGGSARNNAMKDMMQMQAQIQTNAKVASQLSQANFQMDMMARDNAVKTISNMEAWASNQAGVRQAFTAQMQAASNFVGTVTYPAQHSANSARQALRMADESTNWGQMALGAGVAAAGVGAMFIPGLQGVGAAAVGAGVGQMGSAAGGGAQAAGGGGKEA